jgi:hypothetical protein
MQPSSPREWWPLPRKIVYKITPLGGQFLPTRSIHRPARSRLHPSINRLLDSDRKRPSPGARVREGSLLTPTGPTPPHLPLPGGGSSSRDPLRRLHLAAAAAPSRLPPPRPVRPPSSPSPSRFVGFLSFLPRRALPRTDKAGSPRVRSCGPSPSLRPAPPRHPELRSAAASCAAPRADFESNFRASPPRAPPRQDLATHL